MDIKKVEIPNTEAQETPTEYVVTLKDGEVLTVPNDPTNRHYVDVEEWLKKHKKTLSK